MADLLSVVSRLGLFMQRRGFPQCSRRCATRTAYRITLPAAAARDGLTLHKNLLFIGGELSAVAPECPTNWSANGRTIYVWFENTERTELARLADRMNDLADRYALTVTPSRSPDDEEVARHYLKAGLGVPDNRWDGGVSVVENGVLVGSPPGFDAGNDDHIRWEMYDRPRGVPFPGSDGAKPVGRVTVTDVEAAPRQALPSGETEVVEGVVVPEDGTH